MLDYEAACCAAFPGTRQRATSTDCPQGRGLNIAHEAVDRHAAGPLRDKVAIRWIGKNDETQDFTFGGTCQACRAALPTSWHGWESRRATASICCLGRIPELYVAALGTWKNRGILSLLFSAFGPEPIKTRLAIGEAKVLVTTESLYRRKVAKIRDELPSLEHVILIGDDPQRPDRFPARSTMAS